MKPTQLPRLHYHVCNAQPLTLQCAQAMSYVMRVPNHPSKAELADFFAECATLLFPLGAPGATKASVNNGASVTVGGSKYTFTVVGGAITAIAVAPAA